MSTYDVLYKTNSIPSYKLLWEHLCTAAWGQAVIKKMFGGIFKNSFFFTLQISFSTLLQTFLGFSTVTFLHISVDFSLILTLTVFLKLFGPFKGFIFL